MIRSNLSTRSRNTCHTFRRHRGFTLVEVLMSTILVAMGTTLAIPSYRDMVDKRQLTNSAEQLASFVNSVQSISTRTNQVVTVSYERNGHNQWCIGAVINADDTACVCTQTSSSASDYCAIDGQEFVLDESLSNGSELMHSISGGSYSFDPIRGLSDASLTMELHTDNRKFKLNLMVNNTGRVILCSKDDSHAIPGYDVCPLLVVEEEL
ncbi:MAG: prepilin-type N-terminal cleavage/methylation domain-containing protein [Proteobacteria bacterium]|nr:prepilin-type N-terminal cleavage/methylation domain-containing protein [Pseudomonadota bacterium]